MPFEFDQDECMHVCPQPCPICKHPTTCYTGWWIQLNERLGKMAKVICPACEFVFVFNVASLDPENAWMFERPQEEDEEADFS